MSPAGEIPLPAGSPAAEPDFGICAGAAYMELNFLIGYPRSWSNAAG